MKEKEREEKETAREASVYYRLTKKDGTVVADIVGEKRYAKIAAGRSVVKEVTCDDGGRYAELSE